MIAKGTKVRLKTTNGGDSVVKLADHYRETFGCWFETEYGTDFWVDAHRIKSVDPLD